MKDFFYKHIDIICVVLGLLIVYIPIFHEVRYKSRVHVSSKNGLIRMWRQIPKPTFAGWLFIATVIFLFMFSYNKNIKDDNEKRAFQKELKAASDKYYNEIAIFNRNLTKSDSLHTASDILNTRYQIEYTKQLNKWGLKIQDSAIVRKEGTILVWPSKEFIKVDSAKRIVSFVFCNDGNIPVKAVEMDVRLVNRNNLNIAYNLAVFHQTFASNDCWVGDKTQLNISSDEYKNILFIYKISYYGKDGKVVTDFYTVGYVEASKTWGFSSMRLGRLFR